jgi:hypothetical protein
LLAKTIVSSDPQLEPRVPPTTGQIVIGVPPVIGTFFISPLSKKPIHRLSGDMNGERTFVRPRMGTASS